MKATPLLMCVLLPLCTGAVHAQPAAAPAQSPAPPAAPGDDNTPPVAADDSPLPARGALVFKDVAGVAGLDFNPSGQFMLRFRHFEGHDFVAGGNANTLRHRARLGMGVTYDGLVGGLIQLQDVRILGEERDTLGDFSADGLDMHQAYVRVMPVEGFELRLGRQEIAYENHRLIGTVGWLEQARSFDAVRVKFKRDMLVVDGFYAKVAEHDAPTTNPDGTPFHSADRDLLATNIHLKPLAELDVGVLVIGDFGGTTRVNRLTAGAIAGGKTSFGLSYGAEGYYQYGNADGNVQHRAYMAGGYLGYQFDVITKPSIKAFAEVLSGDANLNDTTSRSFNALFHTGHKFYGEMDYFLNMPVHTQQRGLTDLGGAARFSPAKPVSITVTYHHFRATARRGDDLKTFGNEVDAIATYTPWPQLKLDFFYGLFAPGDIFGLDLTDKKIEHFIYSTVDFGF